jgi:polyhydroxybutyrate depolymerase
MSRRSWVIAGAVMAALAAGPAQAVNVPGTTYETIDVGGVERTFIVHVGASVPAEGPVPVVFMFHGTSGDGQRFYDNSGWREVADAEGIIVVFPDALRHCFYEDENGDGDFDDAGELKLTTKWSAGALGEATEMPLCAEDVVARLPARARATVDHPVADDLAFVDAMLAFLGAEYVVDDHRIFASGFSNGAQFTSRLAVERSEAFAALAAHAGDLSVPIVPARPVPFVLSFGNIDDRVISLVGVSPIPMGEADLVTLFLGFVSQYLQQFGLADTYTFDERSAGGGALSTFTFQESLTGADGRLLFLVVEGNTHAYPNGRNHPLPMARALWEFFRDHPLP